MNKTILNIILATFIICNLFSNENSYAYNLDSGLVAFYPFNGNTSDESGNGNNGVNYGATLTTDRFGNSNKAYNFNRTYIEVPNSPSLQSPVTSMTLSFWANITQWDLSSASFLSKSNTGTIGQYGAIATNTPYIQFDIGGQYIRITRFFALNTWYHICLNWDGQKARLYLNGDAYDSVNFTGSVMPDNNPLVIGKHTPGSIRYLKGKLDDIRIYNRSLKADEILKLYYEGILNVKMIPQGFYDPQTSKLRMKDTVKIYLRETVSPFKILDSSKTILDSVTSQASFRTFVPEGSYYAEVKHRNCINTWSRLPVYITGINDSYDFTFVASQAFGNNLYYNSTGKYFIYQGDVNKDGTIDATDVSSVENDANISRSGYVQTDLTGDNYVDASDLSIVDYNADIAVSEKTPFGSQAPCNLSCARMFTWSGFNWCVISSNESICGPGTNYFSSSFNNVWVDGAGDLHLKITKVNGKYYCAELFTTQNVGYGLYTFYLSSRVDNLDKNVVLGLFTWNDDNCITNANSEIDIEFTRWGDAANPNPIEYSVQPTNSGNETDRFTTWPMAYTGNNTIHYFNWTPTQIYWSSYKTHTTPAPAGNLISYWTFIGANNIPKSSEICNSNPVLIPNPESNTKLNMNLWLNQGNYPSNDQEVEVIVHKVEYLPAP